MSKYTKLLKIFIVLLLGVGLLGTTAHAQIATTTPAPTTLSPIPFTPSTAPGQLYVQNCGNKFRDANYRNEYSDLYYAQLHDQTNRQPDKVAAGQDSDLLVAGCPPSLDDITLIVMRVITVLITLIGIVVFISFAKNALLIATAGADKDKIKAGRAGLQAVFTGVFIVLCSYSLIVFIAYRLGLANDPNKFSIIDGSNLIFKFLFVY